MSSNRGSWIYASPDCSAKQSAYCYQSSVELIALIAFKVEEEQTFYDRSPAILISCIDERPYFTFDPGGRWISLDEAQFSIGYGTNNWFWTGFGTVTGDLDAYWFALDDSDEIIKLIRNAEDKGNTLTIEASDLYSVVAYFEVAGFTTTIRELSC